LYLPRYQIHLRTFILLAL